MPVAGPEHQIEAGEEIETEPVSDRNRAGRDRKRTGNRTGTGPAGKGRQRVHDSRESALFFLFLRKNRRILRKNGRIRRFSYSRILSGSVRVYSILKMYTILSFISIRRRADLFL